MLRLALAALLALLAATALAQAPFCTADIGVEPYETLVDKIDGAFSLQVAQLEPDKQVVLMLASGTLYRSMNGGKTFDKVDATAGVYFSSIVRTADERLVYLPSSTNVWVSMDKGNTFVPRPYDQTKFTIWADYCDPHPTNGNWLACLSLNPQYPTKSSSRWQAVITQDFGQTWTAVADYALDVAWAYDPDHPTRVAVDALFISKVDASMNNKDQNSYHRPDYTLGQYIVSTKKWSPKVRGCPVFFQSEGDFVAPEYGIEKGEIVLKQIWHSEDHGQQWRSYSSPINFYVWSLYQQFSEDTTNSGYPFFITDNAVFFFIWDQQYIFSMYVSDKQDHAYSKAIDRIKGFDFAPFEGIDGVYVANSYADKTAMKNGVATTSITYDNGGTWYPLRLPSGTSCPPDQPKCQLNLFGPSDSMFGRFYSWYDAIGLMVGTGTISEEVDPEGDVNTYLSSDGGLNWVQIRDGPTTYEFGDHGGLMMFADAGAPSTNIMYSWNGGNTFSECAITDKAFTMYNILTGNASSTEFWVYGQRRVGNVTRGVVVLVDFGQFHERTCEQADYETFTPSTPDNTSCILGERTSYTRRKLDADCFNPAGFESQTVQTVCPCHEDDYECGYCYEYNAKLNQCEWTCDPADKGKAPADCEEVWYPKSNGWRLVPGTKCNYEDPKSLKRLGTPELCPGSGPSSTTTMVVLTVLFVIILLTILAAVGFIAYSQNDSVKRWVNEKLNQAPADTFSLPESALADKGPATLDE